MNCEYFGLTHLPFKNTVDTRHFYQGAGRGATLQALTYAIMNGEGIVKVVGEVGSGKTMLCRMLVEQLPDSVEIICLDNPGLSPENILHAIAIEMGLPVNMQDSHFEVMQILQNRVVEKHAENGQVVVLVEEAQNMLLETLEEIGLLGNLETQKNKLLQIVLFGQAKLESKLSQPRNHQLRDRITHSFNLGSLNSREVNEYLKSRMRMAGYHGPDMFSRSAINLIARVSNGLIRRINILADKCLLAAYADSARTVSRKHALMAINDSEYSGQRINLPAMTGILAGLAGALVMGVYLLVSYEDMPVAVAKVSNFPQKPPAITQAKDEKYNTNNSLIEDRLKRAEHWLMTASDNNYSIQVLQTRADFRNELERFFIKQSVGSNYEKFFVLKKVENGRLMFCVMYDEFETYADARNALQKLPSVLKRDKPFLRSISQLRKEAIGFD